MVRGGDGGPSWVRRPPDPGGLRTRNGTTGDTVAVTPVPLDRFEALVADALDGIPEELGRFVDNLVVRVRDRHPAGLLGLYEGIPLTQREAYGGLAMPDRVTVYRLALCEGCATEEELVEQVRITVVHEIAHHFGIDDARLAELGWD
jgi:predicted Zn-dependent protease with MMP-like domain